MLEHGGRLRAAAQRYGIPLGDWMDLSTGINPQAYPVPALAPEVWLRAGGAFRTASASGALNTPVSIREGRETRSTISREFVRLVALQCASLDQLSPERIEATDKLVRYLQHSLELSSEPAPGGAVFD